MLSLVLLSLLCAFLFLIPEVQNKSAQWAQSWLNQRYNWHLKVKSIQYQFPNQIQIKRAFFSDHQQDTLFYVGQLKAQINLSTQAPYIQGLSKVEGDSLFFHLLKHPQQDSSNLQHFLAQISSSDTTNKKGVDLLFEDLKLTNSRFYFHNRTEPGNLSLRWDQAQTEVERLHLAGKNVSGLVKQLSFQDPRGFVVQDFQGDVFYGYKGLKVKDLQLLTANSHLGGDLLFSYESPTAYSSFVDSVLMAVDIDFASVEARDIQYFAPAYPDFPTFRLAGHAEGPVNKLRLQEADLTFGRGSGIKGNFLLLKTSSGRDIEFFSEATRLESHAQDLPLLFDALEIEIPDWLQRSKKLVYQGAIKGGIYDFLANGKVEGDLIKGFLNLKTEQLNQKEEASYFGHVTLEKLGLGTLLAQANLGQVHLDLDFNGRGYDLPTMNTSLKGRISRFDFRGASYRNMVVNGDIAEGLFDGLFTIDDPHFKMNFQGEASFQKDTFTYDFTARLDSVDLHQLGLEEDSLALFSSDLAIDIQATDLEHWQGIVSMNRSRYSDSRRHYFFKDFLLDARGLDSIKDISLSSDVLDGSLKGAFTFSSLSNALQHSANLFFNFQSDLKPLDTNTRFSFDFDFKNSQSLSQLLVPRLLIEPGTKLTGSYNKLPESMTFSLGSRAIRYDKHLFEFIDLKKIGGTTQELDLNLGTYRFGENLRVDSLKLETTYNEQNLVALLDFVVRDSIDTRFHLLSNSLYRDSAYHLVDLREGVFNLGPEVFRFDPESRIRIDSNGLSMDWLSIYSEEQKLSFAGFINRDPFRVLRVSMDNIDLELFNYFLGNEKVELQGRVEGNIIASELLDRPKLLSDLAIDSLIFNGRYYGRLEGLSDYDYGQEKVSYALSLVQGSLKTLNLDGFFSTGEELSIKMNADFNRFRIAAFEPFAAPIAENLRGLLNGNLLLEGPWKSPDIQGTFDLPKTALTISFLQTDYNLIGDPKLNLNNRRIWFSDVSLKDTKDGTEGRLTGEIKHQNFRDFYIDLGIEADELLVLNTKAKESDAYYGTAYASGRINITGPPNKVKVDAQVRSARNTSFNIPIEGATEVRESGFVSFVDPENTDTLLVNQANFDLDQGISLDFKMDINPNAEVAIILNESTGNRMSARGDGLISMKLEPQKDLELLGTYTISKGVYRFNIEGFFARNFDVVPGGTISWNGDPYNARLDITALYRTKANPSTLTGEQNLSSTPVEVYLQIQGPLTNPSISFDLQVPRASSSTQTIIANRLNTDQAINQQVFSLLAFNSFSPPSSAIVSTGSAFNQWDIIANQAAAFLNRFTGDYQLSLSYQPATSGDLSNGGSVLSNEELEVGLSKNFFNERLTVNSSVEVPLNENNNSIAGDFELIYSLTPDGRIRAKAFNRSVDNGLNFNIGQQQLYQQGLGLSFKVDFETYRELWQKAGKARREDND